ncbi:hypothetical protein ACFQX6_50290 [Streptosporangium lutulentum]
MDWLHVASTRPTGADAWWRSPLLGRKLIDQAFTEHMRNERRLLDELTPEEVRQFESLLIVWLGRFEAPLQPEA